MARTARISNYPLQTALCNTHKTPRLCSPQLTLGVHSAQMRILNNERCSMKPTAIYSAALALALAVSSAFAETAISDAQLQKFAEAYRSIVSLSQAAIGGVTFSTRLVITRWARFFKRKKFFLQVRR